MVIRYISDKVSARDSNPGVVYIDENMNENNNEIILLGSEKVCK